MEKNKEVVAFINSMESFSDSIIKPIYNESWVKSIENMWFMKSLINSGFINALQDFWKGWFKNVFVVFGWIVIIWGILWVILWIFVLIKWPSLYNILFIILSFIVIPTWVWMIRFKKWYPFIVVLSFLFSLINSALVNYSFYAPSYYYTSGLIITLVLSTLVFMVWFALILKNKELFKN